MSFIRNPCANAIKFLLYMYCLFYIECRFAINDKCIRISPLNCRKVWNKKTFFSIESFLQNRSFCRMYFHKHTLNSTFFLSRVDFENKKIRKFQAWFSFFFLNDIFAIFSFSSFCSLFSLFFIVLQFSFIHIENFSYLNVY